MLHTTMSPAWRDFFSWSFLFSLLQFWLTSLCNLIVDGIGIMVSKSFSPSPPLSPNSSSSSLSGCIITCQSDDNTTPNGPLLAFSYAGMLWSYYIGVVAFLRDHFDLHASNVTLSGISAGCSAALVIFLDMTIEQGFEFGLEWDKLFSKRWLRFWFLSVSQTLHMIMDKFEAFGMNDAILHEKYAKYGDNAIHFGVTVLNDWHHQQKKPVHHALLNQFVTLKQTVYAALCSMRILPFFRCIGKYNGLYVVDGAMSAHFSIPDNYNNDENIIKVGILSNGLVQADVCPPHNFMPHEFVIAGGLNSNLKRFNRGYKDAAQFGNICKSFLAKGLIWKHDNIQSNLFESEENKKQWNMHVEQRIRGWNDKIVQHMKRCENAK